MEVCISKNVEDGHHEPVTKVSWQIINKSNWVNIVFSFKTCLHILLYKLDLLLFYLFPNCNDYLVRTVLS